MGGGFGGKVLCLLETDITKKEKSPENAKKRFLRFQGFFWQGARSSVFLGRTA